MASISSLEYHNSTSYDRLKMDGHYLDWQNQPSLYKKYPGIDSIPLPEAVFESMERLVSLLKESRRSARLDIGIKDLSLILYLANTQTAGARHSREYFYYRSTASAGALYPTEIYVATHSISNLTDGLYHFSVGEHSLSLIRKNIQEDQNTGVSHDNTAKTQKLTFFLTGIIFRSSWKYRARAYRYNLLDTGHVIENLLLALKATKTSYKLTYDFDDETVNHFLGLDGEREVALGIVDIPWSDSSTISVRQKVDDLPEDMLNASRVSPKETPYPVIQEMHKSGYKAVHEPKLNQDMTYELGLKPDRWEDVHPQSTSPEFMDYPEVVFRRRSSRNFIKQPMKNDHLVNLINSLCTDDSLKNEREAAYLNSISTGFIAGDIEGLGSGIYLVDMHKKSYGSVGTGFFMEQIAHICLDQHWLANGAAHFFFIANLDIIDQTWGSRGYRYAMITAGRMGQRIYLTATAMGIGCCGIGAFYDNETMKLLGLNKDSRLLYLLAAGPVKSLTGK